MSLISLIFCVLSDALLPLTPEAEVLLAWAAGTALVIVGVRFLRWALRDHLSGRARYALWAVVLARSLLPFQLPFSLPVSLSELIPGPTESFQAQTVPAPFSTSQPIQQAQPYYQGLEPGHLGPTTGSMGYVEVSEDGRTINYYVDLYSPAEILQLVWLAGVAVTAGALIFSNRRFHKNLLKTRQKLELEDCPIPVYVAENLPSPCLTGLFHPAIYLTAETAANEVQLRHVLTHELTHYAQKDHIWSALRCMCLTFHWFDPFMWWAAAESKKDCELACDEGAVKQLGEAERIPYGRTLVDMVAARNGYDILSCSTTMTGGKKTIQQRVEALVKHPETKSAAAFLAVSLLAVLGLAVFADKTENLDSNSNLSSPEEGYAMLEEHLRDDLPIHILSPDGDGGYITDAGVGTAAKAYLQGDLRPLEKEMEPTSFAPLFDSLLSLTFYYETGEEYAVRSRFFYLGPWQDGHYIFLREENRSETPMLIPVGTISPRTAETLMAFLTEQREFDRKEWENSQQGYYRYGKALDDLAGVGIYGNESGMYTSIDSKHYENALAQILPLLRQVSQVPADMEDFTYYSGNRLELYDSLGMSSAAWWNTKEYHLVLEDDRYYLCIEHDEDGNGPLKYYTPIASMTKETWESILWLAENPDEKLPESESEPEPEPTPPAEPEIRYDIDDPAQVQALIDLFLNDPETLESHGGEKLVDWLTNWTHGFTVVYGNPYWSHNGEQTVGWYAKAVDAGSFFPITIRDGLVEDVLAICQTESRTPYEFARGIKGADIAEVTTSHPYTQIQTDHNALVDTIHAALDHPVERKYDQWEHGVWQVNVRTKDSSGQSYVGTGDNELILYAGQEENVVALYYGYAPEGENYLFVRSESLYDFVRSCFIPEQTFDVQLMHQKMGSKLNQILEDEKNSYFTDANSHILTSYGLTAFEQVASFDDLLAGLTVGVYYYDVSFGVSDLKKAPWAGGAWADGEGCFRPHHIGNSLHFLTIEHNGQVVNSLSLPWECILRTGETGPNDEPNYVRDAVVNNLRLLLMHSTLVYEDDPQRAVETYGTKLAEQFLALGDGHPRAVTDAKFLKAEIFDQSEEAVCARISLALSPVEVNTIHWMAGAGIDPIDSGEYAGMWEFTLEYRLQKQSYGAWQCTETATGGLHT